MHLQACPDCGNNVSRRALSCPACGRPLRHPGRVRTVVFAIIAAATVPAIAWTIYDTDRNNSHAPTEAARAAPARAPAPAPAAPEQRIHASEMGADWPLTAMTGTLRCERPQYNRTLLTIEVQGQRYALNGMAEGAGAADITPIWRDSGELPGAKVSIRPLAERAKALCR